MTARRILICIQDFARGGTERIAIGLAQSWAEAGRDVTILYGSPEGGLRDTVDPRVKLVALEPPVPRTLFSRLGLGKAMAPQVAALKPDAIFLPGNFHLPLAPALRRAAPDAVIVMKVSNPPLPPGFAGALVRPLFRHFAKAVDGFAALSAAFARDMESIMPGKPVRVLHDPIYLHPVTGVAIAAKTGVCNILWAGRLEPQKDVGLALQTLKALDIPAHLTLLGDGALRDWTDRQIARLGLQERVTRLGAVPAIDPYLAAADLLLLTSRYEGQPAVVGEALAHGVPVVTTDCSAMLRDMIAIPAAGRVVALRDPRDPRDLAAAVTQVVAAPRPPRAQLAALVSRFEPARCAAAYLDWFDEHDV
jgi:glycosyltransferase involved in cell wall biosynthesis